eukprot:jgi/Psemu1/300183/fgenesh1_kg.7_\
MDENRNGCRKGEDDSSIPNEGTSIQPSPPGLTNSPMTICSNPLGMAVLYKDANTSTGCSHSIPWNAETLIGLQRCPICMEPVGMICDGCVAFGEKESLVEGIEVGKIIRFKFGKKIYQLSTARVKTEQPSSQQGRFSTGWIRSLWGEDQSRRKSGKCATTMLAQNRIAQALNLASLKILHKGKVLYPPHHAEPAREEMISQTLLKISGEHWNGSNDSRKKKVALVVMGTSKECQLKEPSDDDRLPSSGSFLRRAKYSIWLPINALRWSVQFTWWFLTSFFAPFLPSFLLRDSNDGNAGRGRPHQD